VALHPVLADPWERVRAVVERERTAYIDNVGLLDQLRAAERDNDASARSSPGPPST
jgi:hypothetical protein